jgi:hypothetical protein
LERSFSLALVYSVKSKREYNCVESASSLTHLAFNPVELANVDSIGRKKCASSRY